MYVSSEPFVKCSGEECDFIDLTYTVSTSMNVPTMCVPYICSILAQLCLHGLLYYHRATPLSSCVILILPVHVMYVAIVCVLV